MAQVLDLLNHIPLHQTHGICSLLIEQLTNKRVIALTFS
jgi:hypothetical protein